MEECGLCGKHGDTNTIRLCARCKTIRYCSRDCQARHWKRHKVTCRAVETEAGATERSNTDNDQTACGATGGETTVEADKPTTSSDSGPSMTCKKCKRQGSDMKKCSRCQEVTYCSRDCQRGDWKVHKVTCQTVPTGLASTGGVRDTEERDQGNQTTEQSGSQRDPDRWARLFGTLYPDPWRRARSRAKSAFPGYRVSDTLGDLDLTSLEMTMPHMPFMPFMPTPFTPMQFMPTPFMPNLKPFMHGVSGVVLVLKLVAEASLPFVRGWLVEGKQGGRTHVFFAIPESPAPYFRYEDLHEGHFLCVKHADVALVPPDGEFLLVQDASYVRIFTA